MRLLFSSVAAHGHVLPLAPFMAAALDDGHRVALVTAAGLAEVVVAELPAGVEHLAAGPMPAELASEAARRGGEDVMAPSAATIGEIFGGVLLDLAVDDALAAARAWGPDIVLAEVYCTVGPFVAAALEVPLHQVRMTAPAPAAVVDAIARAAAQRYSRWGVTPRPAVSVLDLWPVELRAPGLAAPDDRSVLPVRAVAHRRELSSGAWTPDRGAGRPRVLVSLGTVFSSGAALDAVVDAVAENPVDVVATLGLALQGESVEGHDRRGVGGGTVAFVGFVPLGELLEGVDVVVGVGGAGTVLAALSRGIPLVVWPQGADHPVISAGVRAAGAGIVVAALDEIATAVARILAGDEIRDSARRVAGSMAQSVDPAEAIRVVTAPR